MIADRVRSDGGSGDGAIDDAIVSSAPMIALIPAFFAAR